MASHATLGTSGTQRESPRIKQTSQTSPWESTIGKIATRLAAGVQKIREKEHLVSKPLILLFVLVLAAFLWIRIKLKSGGSHFDDTMEMDLNVEEVNAFVDKCLEKTREKLEKNYYPKFTEVELETFEDLGLYGFHLAATSPTMNFFRAENSIVDLEYEIAIISIIWTDFVLEGKVNLPMLDHTDPIRCFTPDYIVKVQMRVTYQMLLDDHIRSEIQSMKWEDAVFPTCRGIIHPRPNKQSDSEMFLHTILAKYSRKFLEEEFRPVFGSQIK